MFRVLATAKGPTKVDALDVSLCKIRGSDGRIRA